MMIFTLSRIGSSPLARGTRAAEGEALQRQRFIPARAGNTYDAASEMAAYDGSSPLAREHFDQGRIGAEHVGSSPLARGTPGESRATCCLHRFIPARAGNTSNVGHDAGDAPVHPRSRGEHRIVGTLVIYPFGSSPLARETPAPPASSSMARRFIPARAANTPSMAPPSRPPPGSSPLARGTRSRVGIDDTPGRFISARAGNTPLRQAAPYCGSGSSPLARGTRGLPDPDLVPGRFIPARAGNTYQRVNGANPAPVHPRSRGEHRAYGGGTASPIGSSPLARGTLVPVRPSDPRDRFIPARAGNTLSAKAWRGPWTVHPRSRGEHQTGGGAAPLPGGSSPLARGTLRSTSDPRCPLRFIPARAGNTPRLPSSQSYSPVHPRSRGEHPGHADSLRRENGSSPLARGTPCIHASTSASFRFIPARAGNTASTPPRPGPRPVHPRSRGEHPRRTLIEVFGFRFIPARAGNTTSESWLKNAAAVHPRSRGEHRDEMKEEPKHTGSSPLAREHRRDMGRAGDGPRFIPARAGNTFSRWKDRRQEAVHPRSRGEHSWRRSPARSVSGSSPLARGTLPDGEELLPRSRFIPARAGNTCQRTRRGGPEPVHPRSRGEHPGKRRFQAGDQRFIPARAGNTTPESTPGEDPSVHPRSRGEHDATSM